MDFQVRSKLLGEYQLGKTIGQGAFSKVKLGYHRETGQKVFSKIETHISGGHKDCGQKDDG